MNDDAALLRAYANDGREAAFVELVRRHIDLVYGAAMRRTGGDTHLAADVVQQVFAALARNARELTGHKALGAWLHTATRSAAVKAMLAEQRRRAREATVAAETAPAGPGLDLDWEKLRPLLDDVIDELAETDRNALVMRFLERRPFADIGRAVGLAEEEARMQTERALDRLREALSRRGVTSTATALAAVVSGQPVVPSPGGLAGVVAAQSLTDGGGGFATAGTLISTRVAVAFVLGAFVAILIGGHAGISWNGGARTTDEAARRERAMDSLRATNARLESELQNRTQEAAALKERNAALEAEQQQAAATKEAASAPPAHNGPTIGMARYEVEQAVLSNLRQIAAARHQYLLDKGHEPAGMQDLVGPNGYIKAVPTVDGEDYATLPMGDNTVMTVTTSDGIAVTYDPAGAETTKPNVPPEIEHLQELAKKVEPTVVKAVAAYRAANDGADPPDEQALLPFFATPQEGADFVEYLEAAKSSKSGSEP